MISWIQKTFQHHFRAIFSILLALIIVSFVFTIGASGGFGQAERRLVDRPFFGYNLSLQKDAQRLTGSAEISFSLNPSYEYQGLEDYAFQRAAKLHLADQWHIPASTDTEIKDAVTKLRAFAGQDGQFDAKAYTNFRDSLKTNPRGLTEADVAGRNVSILMPTSDSVRHNDYIGRYLATGERRIIGIGRIVVGRRGDGSEFPMELSIGEAVSDGQRIFTGFIR
eukprot:gene4025-biopygen3306